ncbi:unnamed protein product [Calypogeia fissa]
MAMASVCCSSLVRPILSAGSASYIMEQQAPTAGGEVAPVAAPVVRDTPTMHSVTIFDRQRRVSHKFSVPENQYILKAAESHNLELPASCRQGCCTACAVRIRSGELSQSEALGISSVLKEKGYGLLCVGYALSDLELETQDEDEVYMIQFGRYHGQGTIIKDDYALDLFIDD